MSFVLKKMGIEYQKAVMDIFNYYIEQGTAAFPAKPLPEQFYEQLNQKIQGYPAFIDPKAVGQGLGSFCLRRLEAEALKLGIKNLLAEISSENQASLIFHQKRGFELLGEWKNIGKKKDRCFGVV